MGRRYRNPFKDRAPNIGAEEVRAGWLPDPVTQMPETAAAAWTALRDAAPVARSFLALLRASSSAAAHRLADTAEACMEQTEHRGADRRSDRRTERWDFAECVRAFRTLAEILTATDETNVGYDLRVVDPLLAAARANLAAQLQVCEEPLRAYANEMKRLKAMERLGMGRKR